MSEWFYIKHVQSGQVISTCDDKELLRSQVIVKEPKYTDHELWCWDNQRLKNKHTELVLDIRKGKLRLVEDTEICLFHRKPDEQAQNQLWETKPVEISQHPLAKASSNAVIIYSVCNSDWVLDVGIDKQKLVLFPMYQDSTELKKQQWSLVYEDELKNTNNPSEGGCRNQELDNDQSCSEEYVYYNTGSVSSSNTFESNNDNKTGFAYGLTPSKRSSGTPISSRSGSVIDENQIQQLQRKLSQVSLQ